MTVQSVNPEILEEAYQVFLEEIERFGDGPFEANEVLDALSALLPAAAPDEIIAYFKRCAALSGLVSEYVAIQIAFDEKKDSLFALAASVPVFEEAIGDGYGNSWFDELTFQTLVR